VYRLGFLVIAPLLLLVPLGTAGEGKQQPDEKKPDQKKVDQKKAEEKKPPRPRILIGTVELKDGTNVQCLFAPSQTVTIRSADAGTVTLKIDAIRFVDLEGEVQRVSTHTFDMFYGVIQTAEFRVRMLGPQQDVALQRERVRRIFFPEMVRALIVP
jgi:hypothetical protein